MFDLDELVWCVKDLMYNSKDSEKIAVKLAKLILEYDSHPYEHTNDLKEFFKSAGIEL